MLLEAIKNPAGARLELRLKKVQTYISGITGNEIGVTPAFASCLSDQPTYSPLPALRVPLCMTSP
jgi:hypothetical protein